MVAIRPSRTLAVLFAASVAVLAPATPAVAGIPFEISGAGTADRPDVAVDIDGNGHFAWVEDGVAKYCRVLRDAATCDVNQTLALPPNDGLQARSAFVQNPSADRILVNVYACCVNSGANQSGDYVYESTTNGDGFLPATSRHGTIDPVDMVYGPGDAFSGGLLGSSSTPTYQRVPVAGTATTLAEFPTGAIGDLSVPVAVSGGRPFIAYGYSDQVFFRSHTGAPGSENSAAGWSAEEQVATGVNPKLAGNDNGVLLGVQSSSAEPLFAMAMPSGAAFGPLVNVSGGRDVTDTDLFALQGSGPDAFYAAAWRDIGTDPDEVRVGFSLDGSDWGTPVPIVAGAAFTETDWGQRLRIAAEPTGTGFATFVVGNKVFAASFDQVDTGSGTATSQVVASAKVAGQAVLLLAPKACVKPGEKVRLQVKGPPKKYKVRKVVFSLDATKKPDAQSPFSQVFSTSGFQLGSNHAAKAKIKLRRVKAPHKKAKKTVTSTVKMCS
jgi:hypothetical protein